MSACSRGEWSSLLISWHRAVRATIEAENCFVLI